MKNKARQAIIICVHGSLDAFAHNDVAYAFRRYLIGLGQFIAYTDMGIELEDYETIVQEAAEQYIMTLPDYINAEDKDAQFIALLNTFYQRYVNYIVNRY